MADPRIGVYLDALSRYADQVETLAADFGTTRQLLLDADVTEDSFGMLPESRDSAKVYAERTDNGLTVLRDGQDVFGELADVMRGIRDGYRGTDASSAATVRGAGS